MDTVYLAYGPNAWGRSPDKAEAVAKCAQNIPWGLLKGDGSEATVTIVQVPEGTYVDQMGRLCHDDCDQETWDRLHTVVEEEHTVRRADHDKYY